MADINKISIYIYCKYIVFDFSMFGDNINICAEKCVVSIRI